MNKTAVLCTVYNECDFLDYSIKSYLNFVDNVVIVEGAYQETIKLGATPRSNDGTLEIINKYKKHPSVHYIEANEPSDKDQRNTGLKKIKELKSDWLLIVDGDECLEEKSFLLINAFLKKMQKNNKKIAYFQSLTFVNDFQHYTLQKFPRLFKITPGCLFVNDNYMKYENLPLFGPHIIELLNIKYFHYAFCKGTGERFQLKKKWWETRFEKKFDYGWHVDKNGKIKDNNHKIYNFRGQHPKIMQTHPLWK